MKLNANNERIKHNFARYLKQAKRKSDSSIDKSLAAIDRFDEYNKRRSFDRFHIEQAIGFKASLAKQLNKRTKTPLTEGTRHHILSAVREFFIWLADQPKYRSRIRYSDADYFNLPGRDVAIAKAKKEVEGPTIEQVRHVLKRMPVTTDIERRNRALIAFAFLSGARDGAIASLRVKHVDLENRTVNQDAREVRTKASKSMVSDFYPIGFDFLEIVEDWIRFLIIERQWGRDDPLFPATRIGIGSSGHFESAGLDRKNWSSAAPIRKIFRKAFESADLPYFNPHSIRNTLTRIGEEICGSAATFKAWSQNAGHEDILTSMRSYGHLGRHRQHEIMLSLWERNEPQSREGRIQALAHELAELTQGQKFSD